MNLFGLDIEQLDLDEAKQALSAYPIEQLPGVPPFLSKPECAVILGVSMKVINHLTESGQLPVTEIPGDFPSAARFIRHTDRAAVRGVHSTRRSCLFYGKSSYLQ